jgi:hypothetical protein
MLALKNLGLGGIVCNVDWDDYMVSEANWATLVKAVEACRQVGLVVWLYDEQGYPSGAAGGLVLKTDRSFEALALTYDASSTTPFAFRPSYEHTHASNNYYAIRRYPNLINDAAVRCFIAKTHDAYWQRLRPYFGATIRATFTDEPSLLAVNIGELPEEFRKTVPVVDPPDPTIIPLPSVPWSSDLAARYRERYGQDITSVRPSLFQGGSDADLRVRRQFWSLVSDLMVERYFARIQDWCRARGLASSGHLLGEEMPLYHAPFYGNALKMLGRVDIPGLDMLSSDPGAAVGGGWLTALLPASAALLNGGRLVMTELSDIAQTLTDPKRLAPLADMQAATAWQAALGVTEFTVYYNYEMRDPKEYKAYCTFVGRLNALLRDATPDPHVLLYYPIPDLQEEYLPVAGVLTLESQSPRVRQVVGSFLRLGQQLLAAQVPFVIADHELLAAATMRDGALWLGGRWFDTIVIPDGTRLLSATVPIIERFSADGGHVVSNASRGASPNAKGPALLFTSGPLQPASNQVVLGRFIRSGREILLLVNVSSKPYTGRLAVSSASQWWAADAATGQIQRPAIAGPAEISISLPVRASLLLVGPAPVGLRHWTSYP